MVKYEFNKNIPCCHITNYAEECAFIRGYNIFFIFYTLPTKYEESKTYTFITYYATKNASIISKNKSSNSPSCTAWSCSLRKCLITGKITYCA